MKLLIVDDDPSIRLLATAALESTSRFRVTSARDGQEGFERALTDQPDLILLDQLLPGMPGSVLLERLRRQPQTKNLTVVFLTATSGDAELKALRRLGAADVITKPFDPEQLADRVTGILIHRQVPPRVQSRRGSGPRKPHR